MAENLDGVGMGEGEFRIELRDREPGPTGSDGTVFLIRPNAGMPFGPVAETASGGELSRIALALAAVAGGETLVFDEIDAGIGGVTAHRVAETLSRLAERAQVITITHLPQIASVAERHFRVEKVPGDPTHTRIEALPASENAEPSSNGCSAVRSSSRRSRQSNGRDRSRWPGAAREADEGSRQAPSTRRPGDHRPRGSRSRLGRGARRIRSSRGDQRLAVLLGAVPEPGAARARPGGRLSRRRSGWISSANCPTARP